jgi:hypothetical protein
MALLGAECEKRVKPAPFGGRYMDREAVIATLLAAIPAASAAWPVPSLFAWSFAVEPGTPVIVRLKAHLDALPDAEQLEDLSCAEADVAAQW